MVMWRSMVFIMTSCLIDTLHLSWKFTSIISILFISHTFLLTIICWRRVKLGTLIMSLSVVVSVITIFSLILVLSSNSIWLRISLFNHRSLWESLVVIKLIVVRQFWRSLLEIRVWITIFWGRIASSFITWRSSIIVLIILVFILIWRIRLKIRMFSYSRLIISWRNLFISAWTTSVIICFTSTMMTNMIIICIGSTWVCWNFLIIATSMAVKTGLV